MKGKEIKIGAIYAVKVSGKLCRVRVNGPSPYGGWDCRNLETNRPVHVRGAGRFRYELDDDANTRAVLAAAGVPDAPDAPGDAEDAQDAPTVGPLDAPLNVPLGAPVDEAAPDAPVDEAAPDAPGDDRDAQEAAPDAPGDDRDAPEPRPGTKGAMVLALLRRPEGATIEELRQATGWQAHSVRGFLSTARKKRGLPIFLRGDAYRLNV
jgi:hypothetical protein